ncbi:hypothetical protein C8Q73DRAFT_664277 [Cubamyces lactineus]|nr:hypothetical protein C8Q73DRAFT_664277 [Cubamyces lactineus]
MLPSFTARVLSRVYMPSGLLAGNHLTAVARQRVIARTFLTTAPAFQPRAAAQDKDTKEKAPAKKRASSTTRKTATEKQAAVAERAKERAAKAKEKAKLLKAKEKAKLLKAKERQRKAQALKAQRVKERKAKKEKAEQDPAKRIKAPLRALKIPKEQRPPRPPPHAYTVFMREYLEKVYQPGRSRDEAKIIFAGAAKEWHAMGEEAKKEYYEKAEVLKKEYNERVKEWYATAHPRVIKAARVQHMKVGKKSEEDKRPLPPYIKFLRAHWHETEKPAGVTDMKEEVAIRGKKISEMWQATSEEEKERYSAEYRKELAEFKKRQAEQAAAALAQLNALLPVPPP